MLESTRDFLRENEDLIVNDKWEQLMIQDYGAYYDLVDTLTEAGVFEGKDEAYSKLFKRVHEFFNNLKNKLDIGFRCTFSDGYWCDSDTFDVAYYNQGNIEIDLDGDWKTVNGMRTYLRLDDDSSRLWVFTPEEEDESPKYNNAVYEDSSNHGCFQVHICNLLYGNGFDEVEKWLKESEKFLVQMSAIVDKTVKEKSLVGV